jgi:polysaccharide pyruvyl transferase WcaK-like protein
MTNFIINTTAARNNGDVALIAALGSALERKGHRVSYATQHAPHMRDVQRLQNTCPEVLGYRRRLFRRRGLAGIAALACLLLSRTYRAADVIIGAPGGYLNSNYGFGWRQSVYLWAHRLGKKTAIYAQSVGPLNAGDRRGLANLARGLDVLMVRDDVSKEAALAAGFPSQQIQSSVDAIFLSPPNPSRRSAHSNLVAISVREWEYEDRDVASYSEMMVRIAELILARGFEIEFLSTCQGIPGYIDDSALASVIASRVRDRIGADAAIKVTRAALGQDALTSRIGACRLVIGTRLHMCLLALLSGVPAFNISYESKGKECYRYLGLDEFSIDYNAAEELAMDAVSRFLDAEEDIRDRLPGIIARQHRRAVDDLDEFLSTLGVE